MNIATACQQIRARYWPQAERSGRDRWRVMPDIDDQWAPLFGDCEDWSLTAIYLVFGGWWGMLRALFRGKAVMHHVHTAKGEAHAVGQIGEWWFDNWKQEPLRREEFFSSTGHVYQHARSPWMVLYKLGGSWSVAALCAFAVAGTLGLIYLL